jgi:mediator of RNA polymerase II transcription subunit 6
MPDAVAKASQTSTSNLSKMGSQSASNSRLAEESFAIHLRYGGEYMDENPIQGKPGEFHLSSTGRREQQANKLAVPSLGAGGSFRSATGTPGTTTPVKDGQGGTGSRDGDSGSLAVATPAGGRPGKSPKPGSAPKPKRKKSKVGPVLAS